MCLSAEAADWLWRVGAWEQVVGVTSCFALPEGAAPKPRVSSFSTARLDDIVALKPDLVITFSDVQAGHAAELIKRGLTVFATNQRTLAEIEDTLGMLGRIADRERETESQLREFRDRLRAASINSSRPRVYFEEWNDPYISGIAWVSELIERAGGEDIFGGLRTHRAARERVVTSEQVCGANPEVIVASWCGKPVRGEEIAARPGWEKVAAVQSNRIYEIPGDDILQPGFRLVYGYEKLKQIASRGESSR